jgi:flavin-dependent dehydrogenase
MIHRDVFDDFFLKEAKKAGCAVYLGDRDIGIRDGNITLPTEERLQQILSPAQMAATVKSERNSIVTNKEDNSPIGLEENIAHDNLKFYLPSEEVFPWIFFGYAQSVYGWVFPKKGFATVGIAGLAHWHH